MLDLVLKINDKCNFKCDFCSSNNIAPNHENLDINIVKNFLIEEKVSNIILNGGDPLLVPVSYYWELLEFISSKNLDTRISFTTNLLDFWKNPSKWDTLFIHPLVDVCTSFQYGNSRKLATGEVYAENMFREVYKLFQDTVGKPLPFISVAIPGEDPSYKWKSVYLAQELGTVCRVNGCLKSGRATTMYPYYDIFNFYLDIINKGLEEYEENSKLIKRVWGGDTSECPYNKNCHETLACISPNGTVHSCPSIADDIMEKNIPEFFYRDSTAVLPFEIAVLKPDCYSCPMTVFCNSCHKRIMDIKNCNMLETHCKEMKKLINKCHEILGEPS